MNHNLKTPFESMLDKAKLEAWSLYLRLYLHIMGIRNLQYSTKLRRLKGVLKSGDREERERLLLHAFLHPIKWPGPPDPELCNQNIWLLPPLPV